MNGNVPDSPTDLFEKVFPDSDVSNLVIRGRRYFDRKDTVFYYHPPVSENIGQLMAKMDKFEKKRQAD